MRSPGLAFIHAFVLMLLAAGASSAQPKRAPVCAFLDPGKSPLAALLEAELLADSSATWVERANIDKVLKEQVVQAVFGPQGGADRVKLGKLLKADLLILVRPLKEPALEVVVSDTARGLRLTVRAIPITKDADVDLSALIHAVGTGMKKFHEDVREIVAVPPLASTNLMYDHEHLKGAYAKLMEQAALANPGVVVVELAEAEAIAKELKLADPGATVKRAPPLYLLGEYRHEGRGADTKVALKLQTTRGGKPVGDAVAKTVNPKDAPATLHAWVADRLAAEKAKPAAALDPKVEAKQLAELSRSRQRVADWNDAYALLEASLLLDPNQPELNAEAMPILKIRMQEMLGKGKRDIDTLRSVVPLHRRGFEHMEALVLSGAKLERFDSKDSRGGRMFQSPFPTPPRFPPYTFMPPTLPVAPEVKELTDELMAERRALCMKLLPIVIKDGRREDIVYFINMALWESSLAERYDEQARIILKYQDSPGMIGAADLFIDLYMHSVSLEDLPTYYKYLERLDKDGNAAVKGLVARPRQKLPETEKGIKSLAIRYEETKRAFEKKAGPKVISEWAKLTHEERLGRLDTQFAGGPLHLIRLKFDAPGDDWFLGHLRGSVAAGPKIDVFYARGHFLTNKPDESGGRLKPGYGSGKSGPVLFVMKEKGLLKRVWEKLGAPDRFSAVCFDGRYVWLATEESRMAPELYVLDPATEKVYEVTADDGLPQPPDELLKDRQYHSPILLRIAALAPGRVCVTGGFGRAWVGVATLDVKKGKVKLSVIHEARDVGNLGDKDIWLNPKLAFQPLHMLAVRGKDDTRVLIGRGVRLGTSIVGDAAMNLLVIDPDKPAATVMSGAYFVTPGQRPLPGADGSGYVVQSRPGSGELNLLKIEYPGKVHDLGELAIPRPGDAVEEIVGARIYMGVERRGTPRPPGGGIAKATSLWSVDLDGKNLVKVADDLPAFRSMASSSHYGLIGLMDLIYGQTFCAVDVK